MSEHKRKLSRREFLQAAGITAVGSVLAACAPAATSTPAATSAPAATTAPGATTAPAATTGAQLSGSIEVGTFYESGPWFDLHKSVGDSIIKDYPGVTIKYTNANTSTDAARALRWQAGDPLDIDFGRFNSQAPPTYQWVDNKWLYDLTPHMSDVLPTGEKWGDTFLPLINSMDYDNRDGSPTKGKRFGVPFELVLMLVQYNTALFDQAGVQPAATWPDFLKLCETLKTKGIAPICVSGPTSFYTGHWWDRLIQRTVGTAGVRNVIYGNGKLADDPGFLTAAQELQKLPDNKYFMDGFEAADFTAAQALFFQGKAAMIHMGSWLTSEMAASIPTGFKLAAVDFPTYPGGKGDQNAMFGTSQAMSIPNPDKSTSHKVNVDLAVEFLKRRTSKAVISTAASSLSIISPVKGVAAPPGLPGTDALLAKAATAEFVIYYYGIHWDAALTAAWYPFTQALFLGKIKADQMIEQMDAALVQYRTQKAAGVTPTP